MQCLKSYNSNTVEQACDGLKTTMHRALAELWRKMSLNFQRFVFCWVMQSVDTSDFLIYQCSPCAVT